MAEARNRLVQDAHLRPQAECDDRRVVAHHAAAEHDDSARGHARDTAEQEASPAERLLEEVGSRLRGETAGHLAHRREQRKLARVGLDGLVRDADRAALDQGPRQGLVGGQMEVGEEDEPLPEPWVLLFEWLLHLEDEVGGLPDLVDGRDASADAFVVGVGERASVSRTSLDDELIAALHELAGACRSERDAILVLLDLFRDADLHGARTIPRADPAALDKNAGLSRTTRPGEPVASGRSAPENAAQPRLAARPERVLELLLREGLVDPAGRRVPVEDDSDPWFSAVRKENAASRASSAHTSIASPAGGEAAKTTPVPTNRM